MKLKTFKLLSATGPYRMALVANQGSGEHRQGLRRKAGKGVGNLLDIDKVTPNDHMIESARRRRLTAHEVEWDLVKRTVKQRIAAYRGRA